MTLVACCYLPHSGFGGECCSDGDLHGTHICQLTKAAADDLSGRAVHAWRGTGYIQPRWGAPTGAENCMSHEAMRDCDHGGRQIVLQACVTEDLPSDTGSGTCRGTTGLILSGTG